MIYIDIDGGHTQRLNEYPAELTIVTVRFGNGRTYPRAAIGYANGRKLAARIIKRSIARGYVFRFRETEPGGMWIGHGAGDARIIIERTICEHDGDGTY